MNQTPSEITKVSITSKDVENHLDATIIQLAQVIGIEEQCDSDTAIEIVRQKLSRKVLDFVDKHTIETMKSCVTEIRKKRMNKTATDLETKSHEVLTSIFKAGE